MKKIALEKYKFTIQKFNKDFEVMNTLLGLVFFFIIVVGYSAYTDSEQFKKDCVNPITKQCTANIVFSTFTGVAKIFGYDIPLRSNENKTQQNMQ